MQYSDYEKVFSEFEINTNQNILNKINLYLDSLFEWNEKTNLTSCSKEEFLKKHVLFSLNFVPLVKNFDTILDFGSGNGTPGIIISLFLPEKEILLIENRQRKIAFLEYIVSYLGINAKVLNSAYENFKEEFSNFCVVSKAFKDFKIMKKFLKKEFELFIPLTSEPTLKEIKILGKFKPKWGEFNGYFYHILI